MWSGGKLKGAISIIGPPLMAAVCAYLLHLLPSSVLIFLTAWTLVSFPIGVLIGHCALSEE
jgi:hypothetical protein